MDGCIIWTEEQLDAMLARIAERDQLGAARGRRGVGQNVEGKRRSKRTLWDFVKWPDNKWKQFPIRYKIDGRHSE